MKNVGPKESILNASADLFAQKGFSGVGVRDIAKRAGVNISMISYYFGGKIGILKAINEVYFSEIGRIVREVSEKKLPHKEEFKYIVQGMVKFFLEKKNFCKVAILEMPLDYPELADYKFELLRTNVIFVRRTLKKGFKIGDTNKHIIIGPAFISLVFSNFLFGDMLSAALKIKFDKEFYYEYIDTITELFLYGIYSLQKKCKKKKKILCSKK
jgi:TetR/AcrR family transcriptional regulator